jgi:hypothetical protein
MQQLTSPAFSFHKSPLALCGGRCEFYSILSFLDKPEISLRGHLSLYEKKFHFRMIIELQKSWQEILHTQWAPSWHSGPLNTLRVCGTFVTKNEDILSPTEVVIHLLLLIPLFYPRIPARISVLILLLKQSASVSVGYKEVSVQPCVSEVQKWKTFQQVEASL